MLSASQTRSTSLEKASNPIGVEWSLTSVIVKYLTVQRIQYYLTATCWMRKIYDALKIVNVDIYEVNLGEGVKQG